MTRKEFLTHMIKSLFGCISIEFRHTYEDRVEYRKTGVYYAKHRYEIDDEQILAAIRWHTTGRPEMTLLEKIVFLADYIEPNRKLIPGLTQVRQIAFCDIDKAVCMTLENTVSYLKGSSRGMKCFDPNTKQAYEYYKQYQ